MVERATSKTRKAPLLDVGRINIQNILLRGGQFPWLCLSLRGYGTVVKFKKGLLDYSSGSI